jgi:DNA-binding MarR family transcriptional regulator
MKATAPLVATPCDLPALGDVLDFLGVIWAVDHALHKTSKRMEATLGVTGPQRLVLRIVGRFPGILPGQLARLLHVHPSTLTGTLKRLERQNLIRRRVDQRDRRRMLLFLTEKGRKFDVVTEGTAESAIAEVLRNTPAGKLSATREVLSIIAEVLGR